MRISITLLLGIMLFFTGACSSKGSEVRFHQYKKDDVIYQDALNRAKAENPRFFQIVKDLDIEDQILAIRILGKNHECVKFFNTTSIIIEDSIPIYCYNDLTREFSVRL